MSYLNRLLKLQNILQESDCDAILVESPLNIYYLTGLDMSAGKLIVHTKGAHLIVDGRYFEVCEKTSPYPVLLLGSNGIEKHLESAELSFIKKMAFDSENTSFKSYLELEKCQNSLNKKAQSRGFSLIPLDNPVKLLRSIKNENEIAILREAAALGSRGFDYLCSLLQEGVSELELAREVEIFWKKEGAKGVGFDPIIAFGANGSMPHYRAGDAKLVRGQSVLFDIGVHFQHYHSDMTRVVFFGSPHPLIQEIYSIVKEAQQAALAICRPGTLIGDLDKAARDLIASRGYGDKYPHNLGHGVGLELHELPTLKNAAPFNSMALAEGMVITIEPGIYLSGIGGVRLEDTIVINEEGYENLTKRSVEPVVIS